MVAILLTTNSKPIKVPTDINRQARALLLRKRVRRHADHLSFSFRRRLQ